MPYLFRNILALFSSLFLITILCLSTSAFAKIAPPSLADFEQGNLIYRDITSDPSANDISARFIRWLTVALGCLNLVLMCVVAAPTVRLYKRKG
jgi:hypothetical protein